MTYAQNGSIHYCMYHWPGPVQMQWVGYESVNTNVYQCPECGMQYKLSWSFPVGADKVEEGKQ